MIQRYHTWRMHCEVNIFFKKKVRYVHDTSVNEIVF